MQNEVPGLRDLIAAELRHFVLGLLHHLRTRGGILDGALPPAYVDSAGKDVQSFRRDHALPGFTGSLRLPELLTDRSRSAHFQTWGAKGMAGWYDRWVLTCLGADRVLPGSPAGTYPVVLPGLVAAGLLAKRIGKKDEGIWGLSDEALIVSSQTGRITCQQCGSTMHTATSELDLWRDAPCLTARCPGHYDVDAAPPEDYFAHLYAGVDLRRIFTEEHTGLLTRAERERVEREFKARPGRLDDPTARKPWYANLLSCTPTLEMGIDIGDLSTAILCSVPPAQANYMQRIGRAGRRDGNGFVPTVGGGRPHDLYSYADPAEMFAGEVSPPGVFLDAPAVLERQLTAFCFDRWVAARGDEAELPRALRAVFSHLEEAGSAHFPLNLLAFVEEQQPALLREFQDMFADTINHDTCEHLQRFLIGTADGTAGLRWNILEAFHREREQRDSLAGKARSLREEIKRLNEREAKSKDHEEKDALLALVSGINGRRTLEFLNRDDRQPRFFQRQVMVDIKDEGQAGAWHVDYTAYPFGFEFLKQATFRDLNFGEPSDHGPASMIAGHAAVRPGFRVCAKCGMVQKPNQEPAHAFSCPSRKPGAKLALEDCLYLYREFQSEALRLLLPLTDIGSNRQLHSFVAALQLGLKARFGGSVDHLRTTVYSEPVAGSAHRKQYLVIYDTVPGGTGYLKQLVTPKSEGASMPLLEALDLAVQRVEGCDCWDDPDRDGCYRCLYAYRNARDMDDTSALAASDLLRRILAREEKLKPIARLSDVSISGLMDSVLEGRFVEALQLISDKKGRTAKLRPAVVNQKPGYRWTLGEAEWLV